MSTVLETIAPLVLMILAGLAAGATGLFPDAFRKSLSDFCYYFGMPALLVRTIATAPPGSTAAPVIWITYLGPAAAIWILASLFPGQGCCRERSKAPPTGVRPA